MISPGLQRLLAIGLVITLIAAIAAIATLAALGRPQPAELLSIPPALIVAITSGQLFLGHQQVMAAQTSAATATIAGLTTQLGAASGAATAAATTPASAGAAANPVTLAPVPPDMTTGSGS